MLYLGECYTKVQDNNYEVQSERNCWRIYGWWQKKIENCKSNCVQCDEAVLDKQQMNVNGKGDGLRARIESAQRGTKQKID